MKIFVSTLFFVLVGLLATTGCSQKKEEPASQTDMKKELMISPSEDSATATDTSKYGAMAQKVYPIRNPKNPFVTIETDYGKMVLEMYRDVAPAHADSFISLSKKGFYNGTIFHRIINNFMIQGGDPKGNGTGNAGYYLKAEFSELPHQEGTLSMARAADPNSASCQFFICLARNGMTANLDRQYTIFGQLIRGFDALHKIGDVPCMQNPNNPREVSKPNVDVYLRRAFVSDSVGNPIK